MKRIFHVRKPNPAKAKAQPHASERKPGGPMAADQPAQPHRADGAKPEGSKTAETAKASKTGEVGGPEGPEPTRYGDWERGGICYDF
jgi:hypothetical protein